jgi:aminobenzoyl-glutamate utilization protein A
LLFQPAEEGVRGAHAMAATGVLDDVDVLICAHIGIQALTTGEIVPGYADFFATTKLDATFVGQGAHAGVAPEQGRNALLAAALAVLNLHAAPRHSGGSTRINVGQLIAGETRNSIPARAWLAIETRGEDERLNDYMEHWARATLAGAAQMHDVSVEIQVTGRATSARCDSALVDEVRQVAATVPAVHSVSHVRPFGASDDATLMMRRVQERGGTAVYLGIGAQLSAAHHTAGFDIDEACLPNGVEVLFRLVNRLLESSPSSIRQ